jgi:hemerythrin
MNAKPTAASINPKFRIGIDAMDAQHSRWIELIEEFRAVASGHLFETSSVAAAVRTLERLLDYSKHHFSSEEKLLATHAYPDLEAHQRQHREIEEVLTRLLGEARVHISTSGTPLKLNLFATVWLMEHILQHDGKYARYILDRQAT